MFQRAFELDSFLARKSVFLFGPRQTGKTTFLKQTYPNAMLINLLSSADYRELLSHPENLEKRILFQKPAKHSTLVLSVHRSA